MSLGLVVAGLNFASGFLNGVKNSNQAYQQAYDYTTQAGIYKQNARRTRLNGAINEDVARAKNRAYIARARTALGEAGMGESPTALTNLAQSAAALEQNVLNDRYQTETAAENYLYQARVAEANARQMKKQSRNAFSKGLISGIGSAFNSIINV